MFLFFCIALQSKSQNIDSLLAKPYFESNLNLLDSNGYSFTKIHPRIGV